MSIKLTALLTYLLLAFSTSVPLLAATDAVPEPVLDTNDEELRPGTLYRIQSIFWGALGGGLTPSNVIGEDASPPYVVRSGLVEVNPGFPALFTSVNNEEVIRTSTDLNIKFLRINPLSACNESTVWRVNLPDPKIEHFYVTTGGVEGSPGPGTWRNWFKIEKADGYGYKLVFCPSVCRFCPPLCRDLGLGEDYRLVLSDTPFRVLFKKVFSANLRSLAS